jgi:hypothetical protein
MTPVKHFGLPEADSFFIRFRSQSVVIIEQSLTELSITGNFYLPAVTQYCTEIPF